MAALTYWLWLSSAGLSPRAKAALLERFGDAEAAYHAPEGSFAEIPSMSVRKPVMTVRSRRAERRDEKALRPSAV